MELTEKEQRARERVCLPLDGLQTMNDLRARVEELSPVVGLFKIGKGSFTRFGPAAIEAVQRYEANVFLDLKYHDIPRQVKDAADAATKLGVYIFNVHALGGEEMMLKAVEGMANAAVKYNVQRPKILGVTILTSIDQKIMNQELRIPGTVGEQVLHLADLSNNAALDGIVCSAADLTSIKNRLSVPADFMYVTPGIQGPNTSVGADQKRVYTPGLAIQNGSSILVVGSAITDQKTPEGRLQAGYEILQDMAKYM